MIVCEYDLILINIYLFNILPIYDLRVCWLSDPG